MTGETHKLVANLALASLNGKERHILYPRWGGIESGATLSDEFRIMWEIEEVGSNSKQLVHRCYIDSDDSKDHGCVTRALDHAEGSISFIKDYMAGDLDTYSEDDFLENLGMFLGVVSHHVGDLCTPVHVGHNVNHTKLGFQTKSKLHNRVERDIQKLTLLSNIKLTKPRIVRLSRKYFWDIARDTYEKHFIHLEKTYKKPDEERLLEMASDVISSAVRHTRDVWHTILSKTSMTKRKWSFQPLL